MFKFFSKLFKEEVTEQQPIEKKYEGYSGTFYMPNSGFAFRMGDEVAKEYLKDTILEYLREERISIR